MATDAIKVPFIEAAAPSTPAANKVVVYAKADGLMYSKDDAGVETLMSGGVGGGGMATDPLWDAAGDLAQGTGSNTGAKLSAGTAGYHLRANGAAAALTWEAPYGVAVARVETDQSRSTNTFGDLTTTGPAVTITINTKVRVTVGCGMYKTVDGGIGNMGYDVSGANTIAAGRDKSFQCGDSKFDNAGSASFVLTGLTPGSTTFTAKYMSFLSNQVNFRWREIAVECLD